MTLFNCLLVFLTSRVSLGDEETTVINYLGFIGQTREVSDMKEFKRVSGQKGEVHG